MSGARRPLIGTCQVFGGPSGIAVTPVEVMDIRKSSRCEGWREEVVGRVTEQEKDSGGGDLKDTKAVDILKSKNRRNIEENKHLIARIQAVAF